MLPVTSTRNALPRAGWALSVTCSVPPDLLHGTALHFAWASFLSLVGSGRRRTAAELDHTRGVLVLPGRGKISV